MVDETSNRKRHRYVTVVASGDTGEAPAMIPRSLREGLLRRADHLTEPTATRNIQTALEAHPQPRTASEALKEPPASSTKADDSDGANQTPERSADLYDSGQTPPIPGSGLHHHRLRRRKPRLPHHQTNLQPTPRRHQQPPPSSYNASHTGSPQQLHNPRNPHSMTPTPTANPT